MTIAGSQGFDDSRRDAFAERVFEASLGLIDTLTIHLGSRLGLYEALTEQGPLTTTQLADATKTDERYVREWAEQQAASGILDCVATEPAASRRYALAPEHAEVLVDRESLNWLAPFVREMAGTTVALPRLLEVFRTGEGIPYADYGLDVIEGQADINRAVLMQLLGKEWLPAIDDIDQRLRAGPSRIADIGCGAGWASIAIARAYSSATVDAFDLDPASIAMAERNVREAGLSDRVHVQLRDAGDPQLAGQYDLVLAVEMVHDLSQPVAVLATMRRMTKDGGAVIIVDERVGEEFSAPADALERLFYGWSLLLCLPNGRADVPSAATGTVLRPATLEQYAKAAGFARMEILPIDHAAFRHYRLWP